MKKIVMGIAAVAMAASMFAADVSGRRDGLLQLQKNSFQEEDPGLPWQWRCLQEDPFRFQVRQGEQGICHRHCSGQGRFFSCGLRKLKEIHQLTVRHQCLQKLN